MPEIYTGTKFKTIFAKRTPPKDTRIDELIGWCRRFSELGLAPGGSGNMSFRSTGGFVIPRAGGELGLVGPDEFVEVLKADLEKRELTVIGTHEPSSESMMHAAIYEARPEVGAVFHGHHDKLLKDGEQLGLPVTGREQPYGTPEIVREVLQILGGHVFFLIRDHGFVSVGKSMDEAGHHAEAVLTRVLSGPRPQSSS